MKCLFDDSNIGSMTSYLELANPFLDSACVTDLEYFFVLISPNRNVFLPEEQGNLRFQFGEPVNRWPEALSFAHAQLPLFYDNVLQNGIC